MACLQGIFCSSQKCGSAGTLTTRAKRALYAALPLLTSPETGEEQYSLAVVGQATNNGTQNSIILLPRQRLDLISHDK
jgi:hypothetical protein